MSQDDSSWPDSVASLRKEGGRRPIPAAPRDGKCHWPRASERAGKNDITPPPTRIPDRLRVMEGRAEIREKERRGVFAATSTGDSEMENVPITKMCMGEKGPSLHK